jgi:hypothetical protein
MADSHLTDSQSIAVAGKLQALGDDTMPSPDVMSPLFWEAARGLSSAHRDLLVEQMPGPGRGFMTAAGVERIAKILLVLQEKGLTADAVRSHLDAGHQAALDASCQAAYERQPGPAADDATPSKTGKGKK